MNKVILAAVLILLAVPIMSFAATSDYERAQITQENNEKAAGEAPAPAPVQTPNDVHASDRGPGPEEEQLYMPDIQTDGDGTYEDVDEYGD